MNEEDTETLVFKRFPEDKQEQVRGLVNYALLMGLNGKDLVSIGGKLDRIKIRREEQRNEEIVKSIKVDKVGKDKDMRNRWSYKVGDVRYYFQAGGGWYNSVSITNSKTGVRRHFTYDQYHVSRRLNIERNYYLPHVMLAVHDGTIQLNF